MQKNIQSVRGMPDLLPDAVAKWQVAERMIRKICDLYGYREIRLPLLERSELFKRSIGDATDIVEKEMYTFEDNSGDAVTLRPEATASCARACIQHGLIHNTKARLWYMGPMFRYERPQKGRFRQFHQLGIEAFGWEGPDIDAEIILLGEALWREVGVAGSAELHINSLGTPESRTKYRSRLVEYFERNHGALDGDSRRRLSTNPLRILDSKNPSMQDLLADAPCITDHLDGASKEHFSKLLSMLDDFSVSYRVNSRLVRGLDYYTGTVFEWIGGQELGAQNAICAGGRYDGLVQQLGGGAVPGAGFACGLERLIELLAASQGEASSKKGVYLALLGPEAERKGIRIAESLRLGQISVTMNCGGGKLARQMKQADRCGAHFAIIIGDSELKTNTAVLKNLSKRDQAVVELDGIVGAVANALGCD